MHKLMPSTFIDSLLKREYKDDIKLNTKIVHDRLKDAQNLYNKDLLSHYGCVNAVEFLNGGQFLASGGDDQRVLLWNVHEALQGIGSPTAMRAQHVSNIFCIGYDSKNTRLFSSGNDEQVIIHDIETGDPVDVFRHYNPVYGLSVDPTNDFVFASACDDGNVSIYDIRQSSDPFLLTKSSSAFHGVMHNPAEPRLLATANSKEGACLWDSRIPNKPLLKYGEQDSSRGCMNVRWNSNGSQLLALRRRLPPILYPLESSSHIAQFDHPGYFNSCTMKSCCFAGYNDEYVLSGSDDFNLYMWKVPQTDKKGVWVQSAHIVLAGHRSIVNQVRFNADNYLIASSGVEKIIKLWSPFPLPLCTGGLSKESAVKKRRKVFSHAEYLSLVYRGGQIIDHDYSQESTIEDPRMMAFFDSLVQREIECWTSDDSQSDNVRPPSLLDQSFFSSSDQGDAEVYDDDDDDEEDVAEDGAAEEDVNDDNEEKMERREGESREDVHSSNPIIKLIARKRAQLMKMAKITVDSSSSSCSSCNNTTTASANNTNDDNSSSANSDSNINENNSDAGSCRTDTLVLKKKRLMRLRKRIHRIYDESSDEEIASSHPPFKLRRRNDDNDQRMSSRLVSDSDVPTNEQTAADSAAAPGGSSQKQKSPREGETPDSGIYMLSDEQTNGSFKKRSNSNRNYRRRILNSDSD